MMRSVTAPWRLGVVFVGLAWAFGLYVWGSPDPGSARRHGIFALLGMVGGMVVVGIAALLRRVDALRLLATGSVALGYLWIAYMAYFSHYGGVCLDPGEVCVVSWSSRIVTLVVGLGCVGVGRLVWPQSGSSPAEPTGQSVRG